jgi:hypothetical protein
MSIAFKAFATPVVVVRGTGGRRSSWSASMIIEKDHGIVQRGTDIAVGDEVKDTDVLRLLFRRGRALVVAEIDWEIQSKTNRGVVRWAGSLPARRGLREDETVLDLDFHGIALLEWLNEQVGTELTFHRTDDFATTTGLSVDDIRTLVQHLRLDGIAETQEPLTGCPLVKVTDLGHARRVEILAMRKDHLRRVRELRQRLLLWLYEQEQQEATPTDWTGFLDGPRAHFYGVPFTEAEINRALTDLSNKKLIDGLTYDQASPAAVRPRLTTDGRDCVIEYGGDVSEHLMRTNGGPVTYVNMNNVHGQTAIGSQHVHQTMASGLDTSELKKFTEFVGQVLPTLGLGKEKQAQLDDAVKKLDEAVDEPSIDKGRVRRLVEAVIRGLEKALPGFVAAKAIEIGNDAVKAITGS